MNDLVKNSIDSRKTAIVNTYEISDNEIKNKLEDLFKRINELGETCLDAMDFETKFGSSDLNKEYIDLFTKIATTCKPIIHKTENNSNIKSDKEYILDDVKSELKYQIKDMTEPIRGQIHREVYDKVRDIPVVGDALNVKQHIDLFSRFRKKKEEN